MATETQIDTKLAKRLKEEKRQEREREKYLKMKEATENERREIERAKRVTQLNFSSFDATKTRKSDFIPYYCAFCGAFCLVSEKTLSTLPRRSEENGGAIVLRRSESEFTLEMDRSQTQYIKRRDGFERQFFYSCKQCRLPVCYRLKSTLKQSFAGFGSALEEVHVLYDALADDPAVAASKKG